MWTFFNSVEKYKDPLCSYSSTLSSYFLHYLVLGFIPSFRDSVTKWLNPDATKADLGEGMQAYYDADKKVWVFPGDDPAELAKPIGPPPITPSSATTTSVSASSARAPPNDPLAAMMLPPTRLPSAQRSRTPSTKSNAPPGMTIPPPVFSTATTPKFAVFTNPATTTEVANETRND